LRRQAFAIAVPAFSVLLVLPALLVMPWAPRAENLLFSAWQPRVGVIGMLPMGSLTELTRPYPGAHVGFTTPYADISGSRWQAFGEIGNAYLAATPAAKTGTAPAFDVFALRLMVGLAAPLPGLPVCFARVGLGYHYLRGKRVSDGEGASGSGGYAFIEDGESEAAWHFGLTLEPASGKGSLLSHVFFTAGIDGVATSPAFSWVGLVAMGYRW
jgi:hypothetical protein